MESQVLWYIGEQRRSEFVSKRTDAKKAVTDNPSIGLTSRRDVSHLLRALHCRTDPTIPVQKEMA